MTVKNQDISRSGQGLLTVKEVATYLGCSACTAYRMVERREIAYVSLNGRGIRFKQADVNEWVEKRKAKPLPKLDLSANALTLPSVCRTKESHGKTGGKSEMAKAKTKSRVKFDIGAVYQRKTKDGRIRWYMDYWDEQGKRVQRLAANARTPEEAEVSLRTEVGKAFAKAHGIKEQKQIVFSGYATIYLESYAKPNKRSWKCDDYCLEAHLKPYFGKHDLREITPLDIETYRAKRLKAGVKKSTTNREMALLKKMFHLAADWGYCEKNPVTKVRLFSERDNIKERVLTVEEEGRLLAHCPAHLAPIVVFALNTGMRRSEVLGLRWDQIDATGKTVRVMRTKSGRDRFVPLNEAAAGVIKAQRKKIHGSYVFPSTKGKEYIQSVAHSFGRACRKAGIMGMRFHDLRHTFATRLIRRGADIITVQALLGHYAVTVTQRYTHTGADEKRRAVERLAQASLPDESEGCLPPSCDAQRAGSTLPA